VRCYIFFVFIVAITPCVLVAIGATPEAHDPDTVFAAMPGNPSVVLGRGLYGHIVVIDPIALFVPSGLLPVISVNISLAPKAFNDLAVGANAPLFPRVVVARSAWIQ